MKFNFHPELSGKHAFLSASGYHWVRYTDEKILDRLDTQMAATHGTRLHEVASELISLGIKLPPHEITLNMYVNDCIGFRMSPEVLLMATYNAFGTADCISFRKERDDDERMTLRIHDLKTGTNKASMDQLEIYAAFFCMEYGVNPNEINIELRIYQNDGVHVHVPDGSDILRIMGRIEHFDRIISERRIEALG